MTADVRIKMTPTDKRRYEDAARANGYAEVSAWFRDCANARIAELTSAGRWSTERERIVADGTKRNSSVPRPINLRTVVD